MASFASRVLAWYRKHGRDLPWRHTTNTYAIFMAELMLQQTQVERVIPLWQNWLHTFPDWKALAGASTPELLHAWAGLGYNRRALYAREAAKQIIAHGEPITEAGWQELTGVGPYMAAALAAFINHERALVIDTNIRRVIGRVFLGLPFPPLEADDSIRTILAKELPHRGAHWDIPQALMDIASAVCRNTKPQCAVCPLRADCRARAQFEAHPELRKTRTPSREQVREGKDFPDRIYRGRILAWIREHGATELRHLGAKIDPTYSPRDLEWVQAMIERMQKDGLIRCVKEKVLLAK